MLHSRDASPPPPNGTMTRQLQYGTCCRADAMPDHNCRHFAAPTADGPNDLSARYRRHTPHTSPTKMHLCLCYPQASLRGDKKSDTHLGLGAPPLPRHIMTPRNATQLSKHSSSKVLHINVCGDKAASVLQGTPVPKIGPGVAAAHSEGLGFEPQP